MKIAITGSSGLIGSALMPELERGGFEITRIVRPESRARGLIWDPVRGEIDARGLEGHDAVVHLAGENIGLGLWTAARKRRIRETRVRGTQLLATTLGALQTPPRVLVCASGINFYGNRPGAEQVDENTPKGHGFLADVVEDWEQAADPARNAGIRVVHTRFGIVLSEHAGALAPLVRVVRLGIGGKLGSGKQVWSWVAVDDVAGAIRFVIDSPALAGPVNVVSPYPATNLALVRTLGRVLRRPTIVGVPAFAVKLLFGELATELPLFGARVVPRKLLDAGYVFRYPELETALKHVLGG